MCGWIQGWACCCFYTLDFLVKILRNCSNVFAFRLKRKYQSSSVRHMENVLCFLCSLPSVSCMNTTITPAQGRFCSLLPRCYARCWRQTCPWCFLMTWTCQQSSMIWPARLSLCATRVKNTRKHQWCSTTFYVGKNSCSVNQLDL